MKISKLKSLDTNPLVIMNEFGYIKASESVSPRQSNKKICLG